MSAPVSLAAAPLFLATPLGTAPITGTLVVLVLIVATIGLLFALAHSLRKVPPSFDPPPGAPPVAPGEDGPVEP